MKTKGWVVIAKTRLGNTIFETADEAFVSSDGHWFALLSHETAIPVVYLKRKEAELRVRAERKAEDAAHLNSSGYMFKVCTFERLNQLRIQRAFERVAEGRL